ncbi:MAG: S9 family peptidase [Thermomicrobiales bacterium]|nr:S9 family peptidase [Thermomicrobiales bacterium]
MTEQYPDRMNPIDENLWLEETYGDASLNWVNQQNERTLADFDLAALDAAQANILEVYDSTDRIAMPAKHGDWYYNFWKDAEHPRGIWRRTTLESYLSADPAWELVLDIDALGQAEDKQWVFQGAEFLQPENRLALLRLSPDGGDAVVIREFDVEAKTFVEEGFVVPYAKSQSAWLNENTIYVATDSGDDSLTNSGYAREVRRWQRGTSLKDATTVHIVDKQHMTIGVYHDATPGFERTLILDKTDFFHGIWYVLAGDELVRIDVPDDANIDLHREWLTIETKSDWSPANDTYIAGSLLAIDFDAFMGGGRDFVTVFTPDARTSLQSSSWTRNHLILNLLRDVASQIVVATPGPSSWSNRNVEIPPLQTTSAWAVDDQDADSLWMVSTGFVQPTTLYLGDASQAAAPEVIKSTSPLFDAESYEVEQHFATSADGTRVPYFQVSTRGLMLDGSHPTLLTGYGGFQISRLPEYDASTGREWLENGGVYVVANIRGGGEYGPTWHTCALRENRHRAYEDFAAVARDLIDRGVTSAQHLGCMGGSNGGLLVGNMLTHYPDLFGAIVCTVPLLDMQRYVHLNAGASWIAEYGDPENPDDWAFIQTFSPYHNLREGVIYPPVHFYTATSDDRVGPAQARKMAARMQEREYPHVWFYENRQGGHAGSADNKERAQMRAMSLEFLRKHLR